MCFSRECRVQTRRNRWGLRRSRPAFVLLVLITFAAVFNAGAEAQDSTDQQTAQAPAAGQTPPPAGPPGPPGAPGGPGPFGAGPPPVHYEMLRQNDDFSYLKDPARRTDLFDPIKYIPFGGKDNWYLSIGGEVRQWWERYDNEDWGGVPDDSNGYLLQRYMFHADVHFGERVRTFVQFKSGIVSGRAAGPRPVDKDKLDVNQAFVDLNFGLKPSGEKPAFTLRLGRQEMHYGTGRLVSAREGPNVRNSFDGVLARINKSNWQVDFFATKPVQTNFGFFDDSTERAQTFWGTYGVKTLDPRPSIAQTKLDVYYLGFRRKVGIFNQGLGPETRHTVGARISDQPPMGMVVEGWDYDFEGAFQFGEFGPYLTFGPAGPTPGGKGNIRAWTISTDTGYTFNRVKLQPRLGLNTGVTSGDKDPTDPDLQTFFTPSPNGHYFGHIQQNGPLNIQGFRPNVVLHFPRLVSVTFDCFFFWRQSLHDGFYNVPGFPLRPSGVSKARYIGTQPQVEVFWVVNPHVMVDVGYAHFVPGGFLRDSPPSQNLRYALAMVQFRF